jgi:hypothetical protein
MSPVKLHVTVVDLASVQRTLTLLTGRAYLLTRFEAEAESGGGGRWRLSIDTVTGDVDLLQARLERLVGVLHVDVRSAARLAVTG